MARAPLPQRRSQRLFVGAIVAALAATFGIAGKGLIGGGEDDATKAKPSPAPASEPATVPEPASARLTSAKTPSPVAVGNSASQPSPTFVVKRVLKLDGPLHHGAYVWDEAGVPPGPLIITIDLKAETLSVFRGGYEIGVAAILFGATDKPSPVGVFPILEKDADHVSNLYDAPMPHMLRLTWDGVAIHASDVRWGNATHGCVGVPPAFARKLFGAARVGDIVIVTDGKMMNQHAPG